MATIDIIIPCYNPPSEWDEITIHRFFSLKKRLAGHDVGLIIVNDGSTQMQDPNVVVNLLMRIPDLRYFSYKINRGKGYAIRKGVEESKAAFIIYTDIDWPFTDESMVSLITNLLTHADVVAGTRDEFYYQKLPPMRKFLSKWLRKVNARLFNLKINDTQAGLKGFRQSLKPLFLSTTIDRYLFDLEFLYLVSKKEADIKVESVGVELRPGITFSKMKMKILLPEAMNLMTIWLRK